MLCWEPTGAPGPYHSLQRRAVVCECCWGRGAMGLGHCLCVSDLKNLHFSMAANVMKKGENEFH